MNLLKKYKPIVSIVIIFAILYSMISLVNHFNFRTYALDLGAYTNALYDYTHIQWNDSTVFKEVGENLLADHFDLYLIIFSPLSYIFGTYTLLIVQIISLLLGGIGIYKYFILSGKSSFIATSASLYFFSFFGVIAALSIDYHSNVVAAAMIPWFFYLVKKELIWKSSILLILILVSKENVSLWLIFVCLGLAIEFRKNYKLRNYLILSSILCAVYFLTITKMVMPFFSNTGSYPHFHYSVLGSTFSEAFIHLISHPIELLKVLFINHTNHPNGEFVKVELHILLLVSGLPFILKKPQYLFMLAPIYFQKLFHDNPSMWGVGGQYSIEFAPILAVGIFMVISEIKRKKLLIYTSIVVVLFTLAATFRTMDNTQIYTNKETIRFYKSKHYKRDFDVNEIKKQLSKIPQEAIVSVQSPFLPHLSLRETIYQFPMIKDAEYVILMESEKSYPITKEELSTIATELKTSKNWKTIYHQDLLILKKIE